MTHPLAPLARELAAQSVRYVVIGVSGANLYAPPGQAVFVTKDIDLFLPPDPDNLVRAWNACERASLDLWLGEEPLEQPRDRWLAERMLPRPVLVRATGAKDLQVDLTLVMAGFDFEAASSPRTRMHSSSFWENRRRGDAHGSEGGIPAAAAGVAPSSAAMSPYGTM